MHETRFLVRSDRPEHPLPLGAFALSPDRGDAADVKAFLGALSDGVYDATVPGSVPSGLTPGGPVP